MSEQTDVAVSGAESVNVKAARASTRNRAASTTKPKTTRAAAKVPANVKAPAAAVQTAAVPEQPVPIMPIPEPAFAPYLVWTAGPGSPQEKIVMADGGGFRPARDGAYHINTRQQEAALRSAIPRSKWWTSDVDPQEAKQTGEEIPKCDYCGWVSLSYRAMVAHQNDAHGRAQST